MSVLFLAQYLPKRFFSAITLSVLAAFAHMAGQLLVVRVWLIPNAGVAYLIPIFMVAALFFGVVNGLLTNYLLRMNPSASDESKAW